MRNPREGVVNLIYLKIAKCDLKNEKTWLHYQECARKKSRLRQETWLDKKMGDFD